MKEHVMIMEKLGNFGVGVDIEEAGGE